MLSDDYLRPAGRFERLFEGRYMEAPAVFKHEGRYYLIASGCTGWEPNEARSAVADNIWGPWRELGNRCVGPDARITFGAQSTFELPVAGKPGAFILMGCDRWRPEDAIDGPYVWLPIEFAGDRLVVRWREHWDLSVFDWSLPRRSERLWMRSAHENVPHARGTDHRPSNTRGLHRHRAAAHGTAERSVQARLVGRI